MEPRAFIKRAKDNGKQTLGRFLFEGFQCDTLELPWLNNQRRISCIPTGTYSCTKRAATSAIPYPHIILLNVPDRDGICLHKANYVRDLRGCVGIGDGLVDIDKDGQLDIIKSKVTFEKLMALLPEKFELLIS